MGKVNRWRWQIAQWAENIWWRLYLKNKDPEAYLAWKKQYWTSLWSKCESIISLTADTQILDAGCGPAGIFMLFDKQEVFAFDPLLSRYQQNLKHFDPERYPNVHFYQGELEGAHSEKQFDLVFCMNAINHVANLKASNQQLVRFVKEGGYLVLTIDAHNYLFFRRLFALLPGDILHPHQHTLEEYIAMYQELGLVLISSQKLRSEFLFNHFLLIFSRPIQSIIDSASS